MDKQTCLTCKHEPEWGEEWGGDYPRVAGKCRKKVVLPLLPETYRVVITGITKYADGSGVMVDCKTWEPK